MGFYSSTGHLELLGDFRVVTALEQQFRYLLLSGSESNRLIVHHYPHLSDNFSGLTCGLAGGGLCSF